MAQLPIWSDEQKAYCFLFNTLISADRVIRYGVRNLYGIFMEPKTKPDGQARTIRIYILLK